MNAKYLDWSRKKLKGIIDFYTPNFMQGIKILDLGGGCADISGPLSRLGADITLVDFQQEVLKKANSQYPNIKTINLNLNKDWLPSDQSFYFILHLSLLNYLDNYQENLKKVCNSADFLVLEAAVCDDSNPDKLSVIKEVNLNNKNVNNIYYLPSAFGIEKILTDCNMKYKRLDHAKFNSDIFVYDWKEKLDGSSGLNKRRIWFCEKNKKNTGLVNSTTISTLKSTDILVGQFDTITQLSQLQDKVSMSSFSYQEFSNTRIKFISNLFNPKYFLKKSVLDAGAGTGEISSYFAKSGSTVTAADARQEHLQNILKKYPGIRTIRLNFETPLTINAKYDIAVSIDTLCHISNYEKHLKDLCSKSLDLILETAVCDSSDPNISFNVSEDMSNKMLSASGMASRPSAAKIEKILASCGMHFVRIDSPNLNYSNYVYDWNVTNSKNQDLSLRRFWVCSRRENVVKEVGRKFYDGSSSKIVINSSLVPPAPKLLPSANKSPAYHNVSNNNSFQSFNIDGLTVIIPAYKASKFIDACISSIKNQTGINNLQIIVGIDACQETLNHFEKNKEKYSDIYVYYFENNVGPYVVKNSLADKAIYENILFFDADDILINNSILKLLENVKKHSQADIFRFKYLNFQDAQGIKSARGSDDFAHGVFLVKKNSFNSLCGFEGWKCAADTEFIERAKYSRKKIVQLNDAIFYRRLHKTSLTGSVQTGYNSKIRAEYTRAIENKKRSNNWTIKHKATYKYDDVIIPLVKNEEILIDTSSEINASIIIPAYKASKFIDECIDSILVSSKNLNVEILIGIDNCQETLNHINKNFEKYKNFKVYYFNENLGPYIIKNTLIELASSENIIYFDADDIMGEKMISVLLKSLEQAHLIRCRYYNFNENNKNKLIFSDFYSHGVFAIKKNNFLKLNGFEPWKCAADSEFLLRVEKNNLKILKISGQLFNRRLHDNSLTNSKETDNNSKLRAKYRRIIETKTNFILPFMTINKNYKKIL